MNKEQTARMIALEERNKALAEEVQALEFEVKDKDKRITETEGELELCEKTHLVVHDENQLNIRRIKALEAELQQYREPVAEFNAKCFNDGLINFQDENGFCANNVGVDVAIKSKKYRVIVLESKDG